MRPISAASTDSSCSPATTVPFEIGELQITPVPVPHDAREPTQFVFRHRQRRLGLLTDLGSITPRVVEAYDEVDALLLECNHDPGDARRGPVSAEPAGARRWSLRASQQRPGGRFSGAHRPARLRHLVAAHLSEKNNAPELARAALESVSADVAACLSLLIQDETSDWFAIAD